MATIQGTAGSDTLFGTDQDDVINGLGGNDLLIYGKGADSISGGGGNDIIRFDAPTRPIDGNYHSGGFIDGGDGYDIVDATNVPANNQNYLITNGAGDLPALHVSADAGGSGQIVKIANVEEIILDILELNNAYGPGLQIHVDSQTQFLKVSTGRGDDIVFGSGNADISLQGGNDRFYLQVPGDPNSAQRTSAQLNGGLGNDTLAIGNSGAVGALSFRVDLQAQTATLGGFSYNVIDFQNVVVVPKNNFSQVFGDGSDNVLSVYNQTTPFNVDFGYFGFFDSANGSGVMMDGRSGNDAIDGGTGNDTLIGGAGHDNLFGDDGADALNGGDGNDHLYGQSASGGADGADTISGDGGSDYIQGNAGNDYLDGADGSDRINGGADNDTIVGGTGDDTINGNLGSDCIDGGIGNDSLRGGQGNDSIVGGDGNDALSGDLGVDTLTGGLGSDIFQFSGQASVVASPDRISDFTDGADRLSVGYTPLVVLTGTAQSSLSSAATLAQQLLDGRFGTQEVAVVGVGSDTYVFYASLGGANADCAVLLANVSPGSISLADFG